MRIDRLGIALAAAWRDAADTVAAFDRHAHLAGVSVERWRTKRWRAVLVVYLHALSSPKLTTCLRYTEGLRRAFAYGVGPHNAEWELVEAVGEILNTLGALHTTLGIAETVLAHNRNRRTYRAVRDVHHRLIGELAASSARIFYKWSEGACSDRRAAEELDAAMECTTWTADA